MDGLSLPLAPPALAAAAAAIFAAAWLRGYAGFGFALAAVPLLSQLMEPAQAVPLVLLLDLLAGLQLVPRIRHEVDLDSLRLLAPAAVLALPVGVTALSALPADALRVLIAVGVLAAVAALASGFQLPERTGAPLVVGVGALSGLLGGSTAMPGPPVLSYFLARPGPKERARASMIAYFLVTGAVACAVATLTGVLDLRVAWTALLLTPALALGTLLGQRGFHGTASETYRRVALGVLALIGVTTLVQVAWATSG